MTLNVWNIKDLFSIPTKMGPSKSSSWTSAPSDYNSMSDSQFLFGSQFCPENSQSASGTNEFSIQQRQEKSSQQNSQENEPSIFAKYQSKPQLFGGDGKDKGSLNFPPGRFKGVLEQFEENKKMIKEKHDNEVLHTFILNTKESLQRLQSSFDKSEETLKSILDGLGNLSKTVQETSQTHYGLVLNALKERHEMEQALLGMEKRMQVKDAEISDLKSDLQFLKVSLEQLTALQNEQYVKLCEMLGHLHIPRLLTELQAFMSAPRALCHMKDKGSQTSPDMLSTLSPYNSQENVSSTPPGIKVFSAVPGSEGKEHVDMQQQEGSCLLARGHDADNTFPACGSSAAITTGSQKGCWLLTQELCQETPVRKVIKRSNRVLNTVRPPELQKTDNTCMPNKACEQKIENRGADKKMQSKGRRSSIKVGKPKISSQRKRIYSSRKGGNCLKTTYASMKQNITRKRYSKSKKPYWRETGGPNDSDLGNSVVSEKRMWWSKERKAEKGQLVLQSQESKQYVANLQEMPGGIKGKNLSSTKNNNCFWMCSPPGDPTSPNQMRWLSLFDNHSPACNTPLQQKTTAYCPLFFDSEYSD